MEPSLKALEITKGSNELRDQLQANQQRFRSKMTAAGFDLIPGEHPIILPNDSRIIERIILQHHQCILQVGLDSILRNLRLQFWIVKGKRL